MEEKQHKVTHTAPWDITNYIHSFVARSGQVLVQFVSDFGSIVVCASWSTCFVCWWCKSVPSTTPTQNKFGWLPLHHNTETADVHEGGVTCWELVHALAATSLY